MVVLSLHRSRPVPVLATTAFAIALLGTVAFFAGLVPGVTKTLPLFATLLTVTTVTFAVAVIAWAASLVANGSPSE